MGDRCGRNRSYKRPRHSFFRRQNRRQRISQSQAGVGTASAFRLAGEFGLFRKRATAGMLFRHRFFASGGKSGGVRKSGNRRRETGRMEKRVVEKIENPERRDGRNAKEGRGTAFSFGRAFCRAGRRVPAKWGGRVALCRGICALDKKRSGRFLIRYPP